MTSIRRGSELKIGVGIPCLEADRELLKSSLGSVLNLVSSHEVVYYVDFNDGSEGLETVVARVFDTLFSRGCDVVLKISADHLVFPDILDYIDDQSVTTYAFIKKELSVVLSVVKFLLSPVMWTGVYSLPRPVWEAIKRMGEFNGHDGSVKNSVEKLGIPIKRIRRPKYLLLRPSKDRGFIFPISTVKKITRLASRW